MSGSGPSDSNPLRILRVLDSFLRKETDLVVFGRAALALGFEPTPESECLTTLDVDGILPAGSLPRIEADLQFWEALEKTNAHLRDQGLYLTHLFTDDQVILSGDWLEATVPMPVDGLERLRLSRPGTEDLVLTKMMRVDPQDRDDLQFLLCHCGHSREWWIGFFDRARVPPIPEIEDAYRQNIEFVLSLP